VAVGQLLTEWVLTPPALASAGIALLSGGLVYASIVIRKRLTPDLLVVGGLMYVLFLVYVLVL
jgi:hypothetical protein